MKLALAPLPTSRIEQSPHPCGTYLTSVTYITSNKKPRLESQILKGELSSGQFIINP